ncbi:hypothetical protein Hanom_Chr14g01294851 [Helianthus anomalus]
MDHVHLLIKESIAMMITDPDTANQFTLAELIEGNKWLPTSSVPFVPRFENQ